MTDPSARIVTHMNKDHHLAVLDYVVVYGNENLKDIDTSSVRITNVTEEHLVLAYRNKSGQDQTLSLDWNMTEDGEGLHVETILDIKAKLIAMAKYAAKKQGFSHKQITTVLYPTTPGPILTYVFAALCVATYFKKDFLRAAIRLISKHHSPGTESFLKFFDNWIFTIAIATYTAHVLEVVFLTWPKTVKYRMPLPTKIAWLVFTLFEGILHAPRLRTLTA